MRWFLCLKEKVRSGAPDVKKLLSSDAFMSHAAQFIDALDLLRGLHGHLTKILRVYKSQGSLNR